MEKRLPSGRQAQSGISEKTEKKRLRIKPAMTKTVVILNLPQADRLDSGSVGNSESRTESREETLFQKIWRNF